MGKHEDGFLVFLEGVLRGEFAANNARREHMSTRKPPLPPQTPSSSDAPALAVPPTTKMTLTANPTVPRAGKPVTELLMEALSSSSSPSASTDAWLTLLRVQKRMEENKTDFR